MRRKRLWKSIGLILGFLALVLCGLVAMVKREPKFYAEAEIPPGETRLALSNSAKAQYSQILSILAEPQWKVSFTAEEVNGYLQEEYHLIGGDDNLPEGLSSPRVKIEDDKLRIGVRYGKGLTSTIFALEVRIWKIAGEVNTLALEIISLQAGSLPISTSTLLDYISETVRRQNIEITWFRHNGHPVAVMRFQADQTRPTFQFEAVELKDGKLTISGRSNDVITGPLPRELRK